jgi:hypothetical protein
MFASNYLEVYNSTINNTMYIFLIIFTSLFLIDSDSNYQVFYIVSFGKIRNMLSKTFVIITVVCLFCLICFLTSYAMPIAFTSYYTFSYTYFKEMLSNMLDILIFVLTSLLVLKNNKKGNIFIILISFIIVKFVEEDLNSSVTFLYYLLPLFYKNEVLAIIYKTFYVMALFGVSIYISSYRQRNY